MARKRLTETIDAEIAKVMADMSTLQDRTINLLKSLKIFRNRNAEAKLMPSWMHI